MFTVEQRETFRDRVLQFADQDDRVVAGAIVGSLALGGGDRLSDLDLTFAVADHVPVSMVLDDWSMMLSEQLGALAHSRDVMGEVFLVSAAPLDGPQSLLPHADDRTNPHRPTRLDRAPS